MCVCVYVRVYNEWNVVRVNVDIVGERVTEALTKDFNKSGLISRVTDSGEGGRKKWVSE